MSKRKYDVFTRERNARNTLKRWMNQYPSDTASEDKKLITEQLKQAGDQIVPELVDKIIGNASWTNFNLECHNCKRLCQSTIEIGDEERATLTVCLDCLEEAATVLRSVP